MHAFLITGSDKKTRMQTMQTLCQTWKVEHFDQLKLKPDDEKSSIGIEQITSLTESLAVCPHQSPVKTVCIEDADRLTPEAENALLKTLEEPPAHVRILLETEHESLLLPTLVSRCQIMRQQSSFHALSPDEKQKIEQLLSSCIGKKPGDLCRIADQYGSTKETAFALTQNLLLYTHALISDPAWYTRLSQSIYDRTIRTLQATLSARAHLTANVHPKMVCDMLFFTISR